MWHSVLATQKDGVRFTNRKLKECSKTIKLLKDEYEKQQQELLSAALTVMATYVPVVEQLCTIISELDVLTAFAHVAASAPASYVRPTLTPAGSGELELTQCRHPCIETVEGASFVPNDVNFSGDSRFIIITGPNMGGKSTYIRSVGISVLMCQIGSFVPCESARVPITHAIYARIGASDNQLRGVSTFMAEMLETATILHAADSKSLIIIDELGRGTSTSDGFGLAWAISEHISTKIRAPCLFATHFHELTELCTHCTGVKNRHVTAHIENDKLTLLYQVMDGACDQSFGIHVAEIANFPADVVNMAREKAKELEMFENATSSSGAQFICIAISALFSWGTTCLRLCRSKACSSVERR